MTHPGEQFYPEGVHWDDPIARGTLPDLLAKAAVQFAGRPAIEFRDRPISFAELEAMAETAGGGLAARRLWQGPFGRAVPRQFAGSSGEFLRRIEGRRPGRASEPARRRNRVVAQAPRQRRAGAGHQQPRRRCCRPRSSSSTTGLLDRLIVCEDEHWGKVGMAPAPIPDHPAIVTFNSFVQGAAAPAQVGRRFRSMTSRCCNIPAAPPGCRRAPC